MLRQLVVSQLIVAAATIGTYRGAVSGDEQAPDIATWRWHVNAILQAQRTGPPGGLEIGVYDFRQKYERYGPNGMPEAPPHPPVK
jgi:hypothetical protein